MRALPQNFREASRLRDAKWSDWRWQAQHAVTDLPGLERALNLTEAERIGATRAAAAGSAINNIRFHESIITDKCGLEKVIIPSFL